MKKLLFESNCGIFFYEETQKDMRTVKIQVKRTKRMYTLHKYTFPNVELITSSPFLSWENQSCCGGWTYDEAYLRTAVQNGRKLYAGCNVFLGGQVSLQDARADLEALKKSLPDTCIAGEEPARNVRYFPYFICRRGTLQDFYNLDHIFADYAQLGVHLSSETRRMILDNCTIELQQFSTGRPVDYANPYSIADAITTGLLLGYPLEATVCFLRNF